MTQTEAPIYTGGTIPARLYLVGQKVRNLIVGLAWKIRSSDLK